ncbi:putative RNA-directed DNA polymerase from transposon X-element [Nephila pilipes]|uniref:Putative RNA-directed DNA polymerase from transposon X-element n=1 Tax=Nephila pilipes TaxID=299642 RepID=A0A8X6NDL9_NEPPI|nr:putative RNA-directed DNA polymerase from transposon X-element [Nephila pilipes]
MLQDLDESTSCEGQYRLGSPPRRRYAPSSRTFPHHNRNFFTNSIENTHLIEDDLNSSHQLHLPASETTRSSILDLLKSSEVTPCIAIGDFNAKHRSWNNGQPNPTGTKIYNLTQSSDLDILVPNAPTRIPPNARSRPATIDFAITKGLSNTAIWTEPLLSSDHNPIFVTIQLQHHSKPRSTKLFTNWFKFQSILDSSIEGNPKISNTDEINSSIAQFTENITQAINQSSKKSVRLHSNPSIQQQTDPGSSTTYRFPHLATQCPSLFPD